MGQAVFDERRRMGGEAGGEPMTLRLINEEGIKVRVPENKDTFSIPHVFDTRLAGPVAITLPGLAPAMGDQVKVWLHPTPHGTPVREVQLLVTSQEETHWAEVVWETPIVPYPDFPTTHQGGTFETGADVCLESPTAGLNYQWFKDGEPLIASFGRRLCLENLQPSDSGVYRVVVEDGAKGLVEHYFYITVADSVPAAGAFGLAMLAALAGAGGVAVLRRRRHA